MAFPQLAKVTRIFFKLALPPAEDTAKCRLSLVGIEPMFLWVDVGVCATKHSNLRSTGRAYLYRTLENMLCLYVFCFVVVIPFFISFFLFFAGAGGNGPR